MAHQSLQPKLLRFLQALARFKFPAKARDESLAKGISGQTLAISFSRSDLHRQCDVLGEPLQVVSLKTNFCCTDQTLPLSEASLSRQQGFATCCVNSHCFLLAALLRKVHARQDSWLVLPEG